MTTPSFEETYREHAAFVRRLSQRLVADSGNASDVEQETWLRALRSPPTRTDGLKAWFLSVAQNVARERARANVRREQREAFAGKGLTAEREYAQRNQAILDDVMDAFRSLDDHHRTILLLRFLEDRKPREIAQLLGVPVETIRTRIKRALASAAKALDRQYGGDRSRWTRGLSVACGLRGGEVMSGLLGAGAATWIGALMTTKLKLTAAATLVALLIAAMFFRSFDGQPEPPRVLPATIEAKAVPEDNVKSTTPAPIVAHAFESDRGETPAMVEPVPSAGSADTAKVTLTGRLLLSNGDPAKGAKFDLRGWSGSASDVVRYGKVEWTDLSTTSDDDGRFELRFLLPRGFLIALDAGFPRHAPISWRWSQLDPGTTIRLGDVRLQRAGTVVGRFVDEQGRTVPGRSLVRADAVRSEIRSGSDSSRKYARVDSLSGTFRIEDVAAGLVDLTMESELVHHLRLKNVFVTAGKVTEVEFIYRGPDVHRRIVVSTHSTRFHSMNVSAQSIFLEKNGVRIATSRAIEGAASDFAFEDLDPGRYDVVIDDEHFERWQSVGVEPGTYVTAKVKGPVNLQLDVTDTDNNPIASYDASVCFTDRKRLPNTFPLQDDPKSGSTKGVYSGLFPGNVRVVLHADGFAEESVNVERLLPGETRRVHVVMTRGCSLSGVVIGPAELVTGARIDLIPVTERDPGGSLKVTRRAATTADAEGNFSIDKVHAGNFFLEATVNPLLKARSEEFTVVNGEASPLSIMLPSVGSLSVLFGHRLTPDELSKFALRITVETGDFPAPLILPLSKGTFFGPLFLPAEQEIRIQLIPAVVAPRSALIRELARLTLAVGSSVTKTFTLEDLLPGSIRVEARVHGAAPDGITAFVGEVGWESVGEAKLNPSGHASIDPVPAGQFPIRLGAANGSWLQQAQELVIVEAGAQTTVSIECELFSGEVTVALGAAPSAEPRRVFVVDETGTKNGWFDVESTGRARILLPPGRYALRSGDPFEPKADISDRPLMLWPRAQGDQSVLTVTP